MAHDDKHADKKPHINNDSNNTHINKPLAAVCLHSIEKNTNSNNSLDQYHHNKQPPVLLSRKSLYAPISSYHEDTKNERQYHDGGLTKDGSAASIKRQISEELLHIPKSLMEKALHSHLSLISREYISPFSVLHRFAAVNHRVEHGGNFLPGVIFGSGFNSGVVLSTDGYKDKISKRELILIDSGIGTSLVAPTVDTVGVGGAGESLGGGEGGNGKRGWDRKNRIKKKVGKRFPGSISRKEAKRRIDTAAASTLSLLSSSSSSTNLSSSTTTTKSTGIVTERNATQTLIYLNEAWNEYVRKIIDHHRHAKNDGLDHKNQQRKQQHLRNVEDPLLLHHLLSTVELVGSHVLILKCDQCPSYVGKDGVIVDLTLNTWRIAISVPTNRHRFHKSKRKKRKMNRGGGNLPENRNLRGDKEDIESQPNNDAESIVRENIGDKDSSAAKLYNHEIENKANGGNKNTESSNNMNNHKHKNGMQHESSKKNISGSVNIAAEILNNHWMKEVRWKIIIVPKRASKLDIRFPE